MIIHFSMWFSAVVNRFIVKTSLNTTFTNNLKRKDFFWKNVHSCRLSHFNYVVIQFQLTGNGRHGEPTHTAQKAAVQASRLGREHAPTQVPNTVGYGAVDQPTIQKPAILNFVLVPQYQRQPQLQDQSQQLFRKVKRGCLTL